MNPMRGEAGIDAEAEAPMRAAGKWDVRCVMLDVGYYISSPCCIDCRCKILSLICYMTWHIRTSDVTSQSYITDLTSCIKRLTSLC